MCLTKYMPEMGYLGENSNFFPSNTNMYKICKLCRQNFPYFTTFCHQTCQFYNFKILYLAVVKDFVLSLARHSTPSFQQLNKS